MKKIYIILLLNVATALYNKPGCIQIGNRLMQRGDSKNFNYVLCRCSCDPQDCLSSRAQCSECKHYHIPQNVIILNNIDFEEAHRLAMNGE